ncbi:MAG: HK97 gp10 family phage protein [Alcaligenaceae bacterium]|nr:HK97 gp10 family phage protein [Alcaligenaceae bacterium]
MSGGANSFSIKVDTASLDSWLTSMDERVDEAVRPAAQAMAQVFYDEVKRNVGKIGRVTGNLESSIYQAFSKDNSSQTRVTYHVSWNHKKAPHGHLVEYGYMRRYQMYLDGQGNVRPMVRPGMDGQSRPKRRASQAEKDAYYVPLPGGPKQVAARPFVRPAMNSSTIEMAIAAAQNKLVSYIFGDAQWN